MISLKRILLPTDFSDYAGEAEKYACALAENFNAELHVLHVFEPPVPMTGEGAFIPPLDYVQSLEAAAEKQLQATIDPEWEKGRTVVRAAAEGAPFVEIIQYAKEHDVDLIVIATHGRSGLAHLLLGSVAEKVVRKAPCPVLTVRPEGHQFVLP
jgi:nucleotide-binding universal stress UspA family protein